MQKKHTLETQACWSGSGTSYQQIKDVDGFFGIS